MTAADAPACPDCGARMVLRTARRGSLAGKPFYGCSNYPRCTATHGAHPDGRPLGIPGDRATKDARMRAHAAFDTLWKGGEMPRGDAYRWMQGALGMTADEAHIGRFDVATCERLIAAVVARADDDPTQGEDGSAEYIGPGDFGID